MAIQKLEQLHQGERRLGFAVFIAREGVDATAENFGGFALAEAEFLATWMMKAGSTMAA